MQNQFLVGLCFIVCMGCFVCPINGYAADDPATRMEYPSSMNPVGSGARALSLGGAFISIADDATAASWNPAGLVQLERMEMSFAFAYAHREEGNHFHDYMSQIKTLPQTPPLKPMFAKKAPIMITVDPISTAILKIELLDKRTAEAWISHWESIEENGCIPIYLVCDGGTALAKAHDEFLPDLIKQLDTYHAIGQTQTKDWLDLLVETYEKEQALKHLK